METHGQRVRDGKGKPSLRVSEHKVDLLLDGHEYLNGIDLRAPDRGDYGHSANPTESSRVRRSRGSDDVGDFETLSLRRFWNTPGGDASLELKVYPSLRGLIGTVLPHSSLPLKAESGLRVGFLEFPGLDRCLGFHRVSLWWTAPVFADSPLNMPAPCQAFLWRAGPGRFGALLPLCGSGLKGELSVWDGALGVDLSSFNGGHRADRAPAFAVAIGRDPYECLDRAFDLAASALPGSLSRRRQDDPFPEIFDHLGWCSWNTYYQGVSSKKLFKSAASLRRSGVPFAWMLIDDGWSQLGKGRAKHMLWDYKADPEKFPGGLAPCVDKLKRDFGFRWVGVWHAYQGYWNGVAPKGPIAKSLKDSLIEAPKEGATPFLPSNENFLIPDPLGGRGERFYDEWYSRLSGWGVDFVKVDNQGSVFRTVQGRLPVFDAAQGQHRNLVNAAERHFAGNIIHCMAMTTESAYTWRKTSVARNSDDYIPGQRLNHRDHILHNAYNSVWMSRLSFPDFDMWESHHPHADFHAVLRAVSGGPIYVTDLPGREKREILGRLCFSDGKILRADQSAQPTPDCLFENPQETRAPLKVFNRVGGVGLVASFNVHRAGKPVTGSVGLRDVPGLGGGRHILFDWRNREARPLAPSGRIKLHLEADQWALHFLLPLIRGFAPVGLLNKYLSPAAIQSHFGDEESEWLELREGGLFAFYSVRAPKAIEIEGKMIKVRSSPSGGRLRTIHVPENKGIRLRILR